MKPQLDKIRAEAAFDEHWFFAYAKDVCKDPKFETERVGLKLIAHIERLTPIIEKLLRVIECQVKELEKCEQLMTWLCEDSHKYPGTDAGATAKMERVDIREAQAEVLRILEGTDV